MEDRKMRIVSYRYRFSSHEQKQQFRERQIKEFKKREEIFKKLDVVSVMKDDRESPEPKITSIAGVKRNKIITRRRSPHVNKKHRDQFLMSKGSQSLVAFKGKRMKCMPSNLVNLQSDLDKLITILIHKSNMDIEGRLVVELHTSSKKNK